MILLLGTEQDPTTLYFENFLKEKGVRYFFLNQKILFSKKIKLFSEYMIFENEKYYYTDFTGTLNRMSCVDQDSITNKELKEIFSIESILNYIMNYKLKNVLNLNCFSVSNDSKLFQLDLLSKYIKHIKIPEHIVIKGLDIENNLYQNSNFSKHIVKSLSSVRSIVKEFESNKDVFCLKKSHEPVLFQQLLDGVNIRIHIVDNCIFGIKIYSDTIDYRYENTVQKFEPAIIPQEIQEDCISIAKNINLRFAGIDLFLTKENEYYIFEVNPSPGYSLFEKELNSRSISEKLLEVLS